MTRDESNYNCGVNSTALSIGQLKIGAIAARAIYSYEFLQQWVESVN